MNKTLDQDTRPTPTDPHAEKRAWLRALLFHASALGTSLVAIAALAADKYPLDGGE